MPVYLTEKKKNSLVPLSMGNGFIMKHRGIVCVRYRWDGRHLRGQTGKPESARHWLITQFADFILCD